MFEHLIGRGPNLQRVVAHDIDGVPDRQLGLELGDLLEDRVDDGDRVGAGLLANLQRDRGGAVAHGRGLGIFLRIVDTLAGPRLRRWLDDIGDANLVVALLANHDPAKLLRIGDATSDA